MEYKALKNSKIWQNFTQNVKGGGHKEMVKL